MNTLYQRQDSINIDREREYFVIGCGGTGSWVAIFLAMSGAKRIHLFDSDHVELSNLNRLPYTIDDIGKRKTTVLAKFIKRMRPDVEIRELGHFDVKQAEIFSDEIVDIIFCCTDKWKSQKEIYAYCTKKKIKFIRVGYDGVHITVRDELPKWTKDDESEHDDGYTVIPSWVVPAAFAACIGVMKGIYPAARNVNTIGDIDKIIREGEHERI
jgi:molybdopterin/thiamine biosynthesis adenylyltransferase